MGHMKDFLITIHNGGDEAVAAVQRASEEWRAQLEQAASEVERLRAALVAVATQEGTLSVSEGRLFVDVDGVEELAFDYVTKPTV